MYIVLKRQYDTGLVTISCNKVKDGETGISSSTKTYTTGDMEFKVPHNKIDKELIKSLGNPKVTLIAVTDSKEVAKRIKQRFTK